MMMFSRVGRSISRSSGSRNLLRGVGGVRSAAATDVVAGLPLTGAIDHRPGAGLGFLRGNVAAIGAHREFVSKTNLSDLHYILAHPGIRRFFSNEAPKKKNYENSCPKEKKEIPKGSEEKSESKEEDSNADDLKFCLGLVIIVLGVTLVLYSICPCPPGEKQRISFQEFKNNLLEPGLVDHIDVTRKSVARVYLRRSPRNPNLTPIDRYVHDLTADLWGNRANNGQYQYTFNIESVKSFEEKLVDAQEALGIHPHDYVPVRYYSEMMTWLDEMVVAKCRTKKR